MSCVDVDVYRCFLYLFCRSLAGALFCGLHMLHLGELTKPVTGQRKSKALFQFRETLCVIQIGRYAYCTSLCIYIYY